MSKLQPLMDKCRAARKKRKHGEAIDALCEMIVVQAQAIRQLMDQADERERSRTDVIIGGR